MCSVFRGSSLKMANAYWLTLYVLAMIPTMGNALTAYQDTHFRKETASSHRWE